VSETFAIIAAVGLVVALFVPIPKRWRHIVGGASFGIGVLAFLVRIDDDEFDTEPNFKPGIPTEDHEETDDEITDIDDALADADADAHDGAGSAVKDALDLLTEYERENR